MEAVRARLERHVDDAAGGAAVLRVVRVGRNLELLHSRGRRNVGDVVPGLVGVVRRAVEQELVVAVLPPVHRPVGECAVVERPQVDGLRVVVDAGDQRGERHRAARLQRQLGDARAVDDRAAARVARLEQRRFGRDRYLFGEPPDAHLDVDRGGFVDLERHAGSRVFLKPGELDAHRIGARPKERDGVTAFGVAHRRRSFVGADVCQCDGGARQSALARIEDLASNSRAEFLGGGAAGRGQQQRGPQQADKRLHFHFSVLPAQC